MSFKRSVHIRAPVEEIFGFFKDPGNWREFAISGVVIKDVDLTDQGLGTCYRWEAKVAGLRVTGRNVFTEFVPNKRIADESSWSVEGTWTYSFEPEGSGTRFTMENTQRGVWRFPPLSYLIDYLAHGHEPVLARLKSRMEKSESPAS